MQSGTVQMEQTQRQLTEEMHDAEQRDADGSHSAKRGRHEEVIGEDCGVQQHHQQNTQATAMHKEPSSAHSTLQPDQEMDDAAHDVRNSEDEDGSANSDAPEPRRDAEASEPMQHSSGMATHLVGASSSQDVTVNPLGRGHRRRTQREFFTGIVRDTPKPAAQRTAPPAGPRTQTWEGTYMTPHKARRGALRYAIRIGVQLVEKIRTSDGTDQQ